MLESVASFISTRRRKGIEIDPVSLCDLDPAYAAAQKTQTGQLSLYMSNVRGDTFAHCSAGLSPGLPVFQVHS